MILDGLGSIRMRADWLINFVENTGVKQYQEFHGRLGFARITSLR